MLSLYVLGAWVSLFVLNLVVAGIAHNKPSIAPTSMVLQMVQRVVGYLFVPVILIDLVRWMF